jgi:uncharacterized membrane protein
MTEQHPIPGRLNLVIATVQIVVMLSMLAATGTASSPWALAALAVGYALVMNSAYAMLHEAEHGLLHDHRRLNDAVGVALALFFPRPSICSARATSATTCATARMTRLLISISRGKAAFGKPCNSMAYSPVSFISRWCWEISSR